MSKESKNKGGWTESAINAFWNMQDYVKPSGSPTIAPTAREVAVAIDSAYGNQLDEKANKMLDLAVKNGMDIGQIKSNLEVGGEFSSTKSAEKMTMYQAAQKVIAQNRAKAAVIKLFGDLSSEERSFLSSPNEQKALVAMALQDAGVCEMVLPYMSENSKNELCINAQISGNNDVLEIAAPTSEAKEKVVKAANKVMNALKITHVTGPDGVTVEAHKYITDGKGFVSMDAGVPSFMSNSTALDSSIGQQIIGALSQEGISLANVSESRVFSGNYSEPGQPQIDYAIIGEINYGALLGNQSFSPYNALPSTAFGKEVALYNSTGQLDLTDQGRGVSQSADSTALYAVGAIVLGKAMYAGYKYMAAPKELTKKEQETLKLRDAWFDILKTKGNISNKMESFLNKHTDFDPNVLNADGKNAIHILSDMDRRASIDFLLSKRVSIDLKDKNGQTPLHHAVQANNLGLIKHMLKKGANVHVTDAQGRTAQQFAESVIEDVHYGDRNPLSDELNKGSKLMEAVKYGDRKTVSSMLGTDPHLVNYRDESGNTPLHVAAIADNAEMLADLKGYGADVNAQNPISGYTASQTAEQLHEHSWTKALNDFGGFETPKSAAMEFFSTEKQKKAVLSEISSLSQMDIYNSQLDALDRKLVECKSPADLVTINRERIKVIDEATEALNSSKETTVKLGTMELPVEDLIKTLSEGKLEAKEQIAQVAKLEKAASKVKAKHKMRIAKESFAKTKNSAIKLQKLFRGGKGRQEAKELQAEKLIINEIKDVINTYCLNVERLTGNLTATQALEANNYIIDSGERFLKLMDENPKLVSKMLKDPKMDPELFNAFKEEVNTAVKESKGIIEVKKQADMWMSVGQDIENKRDLEEKSLNKKDAQILLAEYVQEGHSASVSVLLDNHPDLKNSPLDKDGNTAVHLAAAKGDKYMLETLESLNADFTIKNNAGKTPLEVAQDAQLTMFRRAENIMNPGLEHPDTPAIEFLKEEQQRSADLVKGLVKGLTPQKDVPLAIMDASPEYKQQMVQEKETRDAEFVANERKDPFGHKNRAMKELESKKKSVGVIEKFAKSSKEKEEGKRLLAELKAEDKKVREDLIRLASTATGYIADVEAVLIKHPKLINAPLNEQGDTVLHIAAQSGHLNLSKKLVEMGADVLQKDNYGLDAYDLVEEKASKAWFKDEKSEKVADYLLTEIQTVKKKEAAAKVAKNLEKFNTIPTVKEKTQDSLTPEKRTKEMGDTPLNTSDFDTEIAAAKLEKQAALEAKKKEALARGDKRIAYKKIANAVVKKAKLEAANLANAQKEAEEVRSIDTTTKKAEITPKGLYDSIDTNNMFNGRDNLKLLMYEFLDKHEEANKKTSISLQEFAISEKTNVSATVDDKAAALGRKITGRATDADLFKEIVTNLANGKDALEGIAEAKKMGVIKASQLQSKITGKQR